MNRYLKRLAFFLNADDHGGGGTSDPNAKGGTLLSGAGAAAGGTADPNAGGAGGGGQQDAPWIGADGKFAEGWLDRLPADLADAKASLSKFTSVPDLAKSYRHLEQTLG